MQRPATLTKFILPTGLLPLAVIGCVLLLPVPSSQGQMSGSSHDFSTYGWSAGRMCMVCHTPHGADTTVADSPLWNHALTTAVFSTYTSPTLDAEAPGQPTGVSKLCLSCHDGTVGLDSFGGNTGTTLIGAIAPGADIGTDLSNDHPIAITYDSDLATTDGELVDPSADGDSDPDTVGVSGPYLPLFNGVMHCGTCHDVHNTESAGNSKLLIVSADSSQLCLKCHAK
jgi:predicted CXXCH cytochrome family protein